MCCHYAARLHCLVLVLVQHLMPTTYPIASFISPRRLSPDQLFHVHLRFTLIKTLDGAILGIHVNGNLMTEIQARSDEPWLKRRTYRQSSSLHNSTHLNTQVNSNNHTSCGQSMIAHSQYSDKDQCGE